MTRKNSQFPTDLWQILASDTTRFWEVSVSKTSQHSAALGLLQVIIDLKSLNI
ncbi:hypothetical protein J6590_081789 [Homalodisca vitripennis]|nr:hypothetical protein J6590_081789 [Homalodisca vitripennis]